jgi:hypothetical protein
MSWNPKGNIKGPKGDPGDAVGANVSSVYGRTGAVVAQAGDYDASKVTNAISSAGAYADPPWLTSLSWAKITGTPSIGSVLSVFGRAGNVVADVADYQAFYSPQLTFQHSIVRTGNTVNLVGDVPGTAPGSAQYYGMNAAGARGWYGFPVPPASQPLDSDLTAIASLTTTAFGRGFLPLIDAAGARTYLGLGSAALADAASFEPNLHFGMSITQSLEGEQVTLLGDVATPAASSYYGTNASSQRGWFVLPPSAGGAGVTSVFGRTGVVVANASDYSGLYAPALHTHSFSQITSLPATLAGHGISDAYTKVEVTAAFAQISHTHTFASLTSKPTTLAGYGITDAAPISHTHPFSQITSTPTTLAGYGISDAYTKTEMAASFAPIARAVPTGGAIGQLIRKKSATDGDTEWKLPANFQDVVKSNVTITGATAKNFGVGNVLTPTFSGKVLVIINTQLSTTGGYITQAGIHYAPGALPTNNTPAVASPYAGNIYQTVANATSDAVTFIALVTGLTIGTQYWFDLQGQNTNAAAVCNAILPVATLIEIP